MTIWQNAPKTIRGIAKSNHLWFTNPCNSRKRYSLSGFLAKVDIRSEPACLTKNGSGSCWFSVFTKSNPDEIRYPGDCPVSKTPLPHLLPTRLILSHHSLFIGDNCRFSAICLNSVIEMSRGFCYNEITWFSKKLAWLNSGQRFLKMDKQTQSWCDLSKS